MWYCCSASSRTWLCEGDWASWKEMRLLEVVRECFGCVFEEFERRGTERLVNRDMGNDDC